MSIESMSQGSQDDTKVLEGIQERNAAEDKERLDEANDFITNSGEFQLADGLEIDVGEGNERRFVPGGQDDPMHRTMPLTWGKHHNIIGAVDKNGQVWITPWTQSIEDKLRHDLRLKETLAGIPMVDEMPKNPGVRERWQAKLDAAAKEKKEQN